MNSFETIRQEVDELVDKVSVCLAGPTREDILVQKNLLRRIGNLKTSIGSVARHPWHKLEERLVTAFKVTTKPPVKPKPSIPKEKIHDSRDEFGKVIEDDLRKWVRERKKRFK